MRKFRTLLYTVFFVVTAMVPLRMCVMSVVRIPEEGGRPVFCAGDRVAVDKTAYGLRLPFMRWNGYRRIGGVEVKRGEWMLFNSPATDEAGKPVDERSLYMACCYALPGDSLWIDRRGNVYRDRPPHSVAAECRAVEMPRKNAYAVIDSDNIYMYCHLINLYEGKRAVVERVSPGTTGVSSAMSLGSPAMSADSLSIAGYSLSNADSLSISGDSDSFAIAEPLSISGDSLVVEGRRVKSFLFTRNYYWVHSADHEYCQDSRAFGPVPETHIIGRLKRIVFSWDSTAEWYRRIRFERIGMKVRTEEY